MSTIHFSKAHFITSCVEESTFPRCFSGKEPFPEIAIVGRSNAGKSSLINHLTQKKNLVYVSSTPGKTQQINFFSIDNRLLLVDLPGYGFAKIAKAERHRWGQILSNYLENRPQLKLLIIVLDSRRDLSVDDEAMISWALSQQKPMLFILSKSDKLSTAEKKQAPIRLLEALNKLQVPELNYVLYSTHEKACRSQLEQIISLHLRH
jgi:GTP-binding protein